MEADSQSTGDSNISHTLTACHTRAAYERQPSGSPAKVNWGDCSMNEVIRSLGRHRSRRDMSKHARTLQKACKRIRNDPFFRGWRFAFVDRDSTHGGLTEECVLGIIACPSWADCGSERLVIVARHTDGRDWGRRRRPARVEYAIKNIVLSPPGSLHTDRGGNEDTYPPHIEPISLAAAFRETAYEWEAQLARKMTRLSSVRTDQGQEDHPLETRVRQ